MSGPLPLFHQAYGEGLARLPAPIVLTHAVHDRLSLEGEADTTLGSSALARLLCRLLRLPPERRGAPLHVTMTRTKDGEHWRRLFGGHAFETRFRLGPEPGTVVELLWPMAAVSRLDVDAGGVTQILVGLRVMGLPVPRTLWPRLDVREGADGSRYTFDMSITLPWRARLVRYKGWLETRGVQRT